MGLNFQELLRKREEHWLLASIDDHLNQVDTARPPDQHFHPSGVAGVHTQCVRYLTYTLYKRPRGKNISSKLQRIFDVGKDMHIRYQNMFKEMDILVAMEVPVHNELPPIKGNADAIILKPYTKERHVAELKTINSQSFRALIKPKFDHLIQVNLYMLLLNIFRGIVLYENKDTQEFKVYEVEYDTDLITPLMERMVVAHGYFQVRRLPPMTEKIELCPSCPFVEECKGILSNGSSDIGDGEVCSSLEN